MVTLPETPIFRGWLRLHRAWCSASGAVVGWCAKSAAPSSEHDSSSMSRHRMLQIRSFASLRSVTRLILSPSSI